MPALHGDIVVLRPLAFDDAACLRAIRHEPAVHAWWGHMEADFPFDEPESTRFTIWVDGQIAGLIQYGEEDEPEYRHAWMDIFVATEFQPRHRHRRGQAARPPPGRGAWPPPPDDRPRRSTTPPPSGPTRRRASSASASCGWPSAAPRAYGVMLSSWSRCFPPSSVLPRTNRPPTGIRFRTKVERLSFRIRNRRISLAEHLGEFRETETGQAAHQAELQAPQAWS